MKQNLAFIVCIALISACGGSNSPSDEPDPVQSSPESSQDQFEFEVNNGYFMQSTVIYNEANEIIRSTTREIDYDQRRVDLSIVYTNDPSATSDPPTKIYFDEMGRMTLREVTRDGVVTTTNYSYNELGLLSQLDREGERPAKYNYEYNNSAQISRIQKEFTYEIQTGIEPESVEIQQEKCEVIVEYTQSGDRMGAEEYCSIIGGPDGSKLNAIATIKFDGLGQVVEQIKCYTECTLSPDSHRITTTYSYDDNGNVIESTWLVEYGDPTRDNRYERTTHEYIKAEQPIYNEMLRDIYYFPL